MNNKRNKVGIFIADSNGGYPVPASRGGSVATLVEHLINLNSKKHLVEFEIITFYEEEAKNKSENFNNVSFIWIKPPAILKGLDWLLFNFVRCFMKKKKAISYKSIFSLLYYIIFSQNLLRHKSYDKVVFENNIPLAWCIKLSKYQGEYYYHLHNVPRINARCKGVFENCSGYLCVSRYVAEQICSENNPIGPIAKSKAIICHNCVDINIFKPIFNEKEKEMFRNKYGINKQDKIVIFAGRISKEKGPDILIKAIKKIKDENIKVLVVGEYNKHDLTTDGFFKNLYEMSNQLHGRVVFTGYITQDKLPVAYNLADVAVLPSIWEEPAGLTMIEAMACGTPVITTKSGGIPEYVGSYSVVLSKDDFLADNIAKSILNVLNQQKDTKMMIEQGIKHINKNFSSNDYLFRFVEKINFNNRL